MFFSHYSGIQDARSGLQGVYCRINTQFHNGTGKHCSSIQMSKSGCRSRVCQVICRHIYCLHRSDRTVLCGSDALLKSTHFCLQRRLITYGRRHTSHKGGNLGSCLGETENIVDEKQYILSAFVAEIFCHGKSRQANTHSGSGGLVHLSEHHGGFIDNTGLSHFVIKVVSFTGTLSHTGKYGISAMLCGNVTDKLLDQYGFSYSCTAEEADLSAFLIRAEKVYHLDAGFQHLCGSCLFFKTGSFSVDGPMLHIRGSLFIIDGITNNIKHTSQSLFPYRYGDRTACTDGFHTSDQSVCRTHSDAFYSIISQMLCHLYHQCAAIPCGDVDGIIDLRQIALRKFDIQYCTDDLGDLSFYLF